MNSEEIDKYIEEFRLTYLSQDFKWRRGQNEAIKSIIECYIKKTHNFVILDAPVGSGKSILALCVSWILNHLNKRGFILTSDISLQEQYESDLEKFNLDFGCVKGLNNYICNSNNETVSLGDCHIRSKAPKSMKCYESCAYYSKRNAASKTDTSVLNYAYWLIQQNYVNKMSDVNEPMFPPREFLIADEGHKIVDIVQSHYSPRVDSKTLEKLDKLRLFFKTYKFEDYTKQYEAIKDLLHKINDTENQDTLHEILKSIELEVEEIKPAWELLKGRVKKEYNDKRVPKEWREALFLCDWLKDFHCKLEDYNEIISKTTTRNLVKNPNGEEIIFNCLHEHYLMYKYFYEWSKFTVVMSATFSDPKQYLKNIGIKNAKYIKLDSSFDFSKSPIYFYNTHKMSYKDINSSLPWLYSKVDEILNNHPNENGIIHSVSFDLALKVFKNISKENQKRLLMYNDTTEKRQVIEILKHSKNRVLIGPSFMEGIDLKNNHSRFCIFLKVPYLSLSDKFVSLKLKINPNWYKWKAILNIIQGIGRSVRTEEDYASSYILDANFCDLLHNNMSAFPNDFIGRLKLINDI